MADRPRGRGDDGRRPLFPAGADGRTRPVGLRRVPLRHGRIRRQPADRARQRLHRCRGGIALAKHAGPADVQFDPGPRFPLVASRRRSDPHRRDRRQRRRHADDAVVRGRPAAGRRVSGRDGLDQHAGGLRMRGGRPVADADQQHRHRRSLRTQTAGDERRPRLDDRHRNERAPRAQADLRALRPGRRRLRQMLSPVRPQLQPRLPHADVRVVQRPPQPGAQVADRRRGFLAAWSRRN